MERDTKTRGNGRGERQTFGNMLNSNWSRWGKRFAVAKSNGNLKCNSGSFLTDIPWRFYRRWNGDPVWGHYKGCWCVENNADGGRKIKDSISTNISNRERCDVNKSKFSDQIKKYQTEINNLNNEKEALDQDGLIMDKEISRITNILDDLTQTHNECKRRSLNQQPPAQQPPAQQPLSNYFGYFGEDPPCTNAKYLVKRSWFNLPRDRTLQSNCQIRHANRQEIEEWQKMGSNDFSNWKKTQPPAQQPLSNYFGYFGKDPPCTNAKYLVKRSWFNLPRDRTLQSNCQIRKANMQEYEEWQKMGSNDFSNWQSP